MFPFQYNIQNVVLKLVLMAWSMPVTFNWTYTECCIETFWLSLKFYCWYGLNLYRMLYWNSWWNASIVSGVNSLNLYRMLYWNTILSWQNWVIVYWTYTECCIETVLFINYNCQNPNHWTYTECCIETCLMWKLHYF